MAKIFVLLGPTAVGKTACIKEIAPVFSGVIYADTACMYKDLHVGTAKPSTREQAILPHHLIDILDLDQTFDAGMFFQQAESICTRHQNDKPLILSGGTLFYILNFLFGLSETPPAKLETRLYWQERLISEGIDALYQELTRVDSITAERLKTHDRYRITRALEVYTDTGKCLSSFTPPSQIRMDHDWLILQLDRPRKELYERINERVEDMWEAGLVEEVEELICKKNVTKDCPAMKAIGYKQFFLGLPDKQSIKRQIQIDTRHYAKRQLTFLKRLPIHHCSADNLFEVSKIIENWLR